MTSKKEKYLRINKKHKNLDKIKSKLPQFFTYLFNGELKLSAKTFILLSIASAVILGFLYSILVKKPMVVFMGALIGLCLPYVMYAPSALINKVIEDALAYKEFISILMSNVKATNSTQEAIMMCANESELPKSIMLPVQKIVSDIKLGSSLEEALMNAEQNNKNVYFKMALAILRVNNDVGTDKTLIALKNIQKSQDSILSNIELLKDKINTILMEKSIFIFAAIASPCLHTTMFSSLTQSFYDNVLWQFVVVLILTFSLIGQFVIVSSSVKALNNL